MKNNTQPLLSIGIIFRDDIRCIERCLKALAPLRETVSCELIMADTGSVDGSREVAERYADILFDFPWIGDFSAARNAVMNRASGRWYLTVDTDEYLDSNISELTEFLHDTKQQTESVCGVVQRNYETMEMGCRYSDFIAVRMICMSTGIRYQGIIHEAWPIEEHNIKNIRALSETVLHHDGYVGLDDERGKEKRERNLALLRKCLDHDPNDLKVLLQYVESGRREEDYLEMLRRAVKVVKEKKYGWSTYGPPLMRYAIKAALEKEAPEFEEWTQLARSMFPDSLYTQIDIGYIVCAHALKNQDFSGAIRYGEQYLKAVAKFRKNKDSLADTVPLTRPEGTCRSS